MNGIKKILGKILPRSVKDVILFILKKIHHIKEYPLIKQQPSLHKKALEEVRQKAKKGEKIKVAFFVVHSSVWKYEGVYNLFLEDKRFEPIVIICPVVNYGRENMLNEMEKAYNLFKRQGYNVIRAYDEEKDIYLDVKKEINPDIIFYTNPYKGLIDDRYFITEFRDKLTCYVNYAFPMVDIKVVDLYNLMFHNILWKNFSETEMIQDYKKIHMRNNGINLELTGYPGTDMIIFDGKTENNKWKNSNNNLKRIIWAPHHLIEDSNGINKKSFIDYHELMLDILEKYKSKIQIAFKPHPLLKIKLYSHEDWGKEKTDKYYSYWEELPNAQLETDDYIDLFNSSDAIIHDSGSFMIEYLYTGKPGLYLFVSDEFTNVLNDFGELAFNQYYHGTKSQDIISFIEDVVIGGGDNMIESRRKFYNEFLLPPNNRTASGNIYNNICKEVFVSN